MATAGFQCKIQIAASTTVLTGEGMTDSGDGLRYYMTDAADQPLDPATAITVYDGGSPVAAADYTVNHLMGYVTFASSPAGAVTLDGARLNLVTVAEARQFTFTSSRALLDDTVFEDTAVSRLASLRDVSVTFSMLTSDVTDLDAGAGTTTINDILANGTAKLLDISFGSGVTKRARAFVLFESDEVSAQPDALVEWSISAMGALPGAAIYSAWIGDPTA